ncbi:centromere protein B, putative [Ixodes scapularis]|uniref:Centromere protein B, putative n=1 Tax=Ixodes scapularis TaxID=6945 RepID=B7PAF0_IXOSC|nr:centromere protein B, putative [Ixodes scapularis]|eukprot:XP_002406818.1 centromere protein B, putative [Ixodes scapularis]
MFHKRPADCAREVLDEPAEAGVEDVRGFLATWAEIMTGPLPPPIVEPLAKPDGEIDIFPVTVGELRELELTNVQLRYFPPNATSVIQPLGQGIINSVKSAYKCRVIDKLLLNLEHDRATKIDIYTAIALITESWKTTRTSVIVNCFRHAGFKTSDAEDLSNLELPSQEATPSSWEALRQLGHVSEDSSFRDYLRDDADADIQTTEGTKMGLTPEARGALPIIIIIIAISL